MGRFFRLFVGFIIFLDVAIFPFNCSGNSDSNLVYIHIMTEVQIEDNINYDYVDNFSDRLLFDDFKVGDTINENDVTQFLDSVHKSEEVNITVVKYQIMDRNISTSHRDITLPYTIAKEDKLQYLRGIRGAAHFVVIVTVDTQQNNGD
jgi:hypothetical protein